MKSTIDAMRGCKLGISLTDPVLAVFQKDFNKAFKNGTDLSELMDVVRDMMVFEWRGEGFWRETFEFLWEIRGELFKEDTRIIGFFFSLMQSPYKDAFIHSQPSCISTLQQFLMNARSSIKTQNLPLEGLVELLSLNNELGLDNQIFTKLFQGKLMPRYRELKKKSTTFFLSNVDLALYRSFYQPFPNKEAKGELFKLINELTETVIYNDLSNYDTDLQKYEFMDTKSEEVGFKDLLNFKTLSNLLLIFSDQRFYNEDLINRVEDAILRKSETDLADFKSSSLLISQLSKFPASGTHALLRLSEMILALLDEEGSLMSMYFTKANILNLIDGVSMMAYQKNVESEVLEGILERLASILAKGELRYGGLGADDWEFVKKVYGMKRFGVKFKGFIDFVNNKKLNPK